MSDNGTEQSPALTPPDAIVGYAKRAIVRLDGGGSLPGNKELTEHVYPMIRQLADHVGGLWDAIDELTDVEGARKTLAVIKMLVEKAGSLDSETQEKVAEVTAILAERIVSAGADEPAAEPS